MFADGTSRDPRRTYPRDDDPLPAGASWVLPTFLEPLVHLTVAVPAALALALSLAAPVAAQESPPPSVCPDVSYGVSQEQLRGPADEPVTLHFSSDVQPAKTPDGWTLTRISPGPQALLQTAPSAPSATFTVTASETTTYRITAEGPDGCGPVHADFTRTVTSPAPHQDTAVSCPNTTTTGHTVASNQPVEVVVTEAGATSTSRLYRREADGTDTVVREGQGNPTWTVAVPQTTLLGVGGQASGGQEGCPLRLVRLEVKPTLSISAVRTSPRSWTFSGRVTPGRGQSVALYRVEDSGRRVLTSTSSVRADGTYRMERRFTGAGRFGFLVSVVRSSTNLAGSSPVRPTVLH